jgi:hypothetical protein
MGSDAAVAAFELIIDDCDAQLAISSKPLVIAATRVRRDQLIGFPPSGKQRARSYT